MPEKYEGLGLSLLYPETWKLDEDEDAGSVSLETPSGSFLTITACDDLAFAFEQAASAMRAEYDEIEEELVDSTLVGQRLEGVVQRFVYLDLIVTSRLLRLDLGEKKYLIQIQGEDSELDAQHRVFEAVLTSMCQSLVD
jgi:hypothetical protein